MFLAFPPVYPTFSTPSLPLKNGVYRYRYLVSSYSGSMSGYIAFLEISPCKHGYNVWINTLAPVPTSQPYAPSARF